MENDVAYPLTESRDSQHLSVSRDSLLYTGVSVCVVVGWIVDTMKDLQVISMEEVFAREENLRRIIHE